MMSEHVLSTGATMPALGLGTWRLDGSVGTDTILEALDIGYRHLDTAQKYFNEASVGNALTATDVARSDIFLTTKIDDTNHGPGDLARSFDTSLRQLQTPYVDLLLLHWPVQWEIMESTLEALVAIHADGRARHIGVSNFEPDQVDFVRARGPIEVNQIEYHALLDQRPVVEHAGANGMQITAHCPIARNRVADNRDICQVAARQSAARGVHTSPAQVALAWLLAQPNVSAIPNSSRSDRLSENLAATTIVLSKDDLAAIDATDKSTRIVSPPKSPWRRPGLRRN